MCLSEWAQKPESYSVIIRLGFMFMCLAKQVMMFKFLDQFIWALEAQMFKFKQQVMLVKWFVSIVVVTVMRSEFVVDIIRSGFVFMCQARQVTQFKYLDQSTEQFVVKMFESKQQVMLIKWFVSIIVIKSDFKFESPTDIIRTKSTFMYLAE